MEASTVARFGRRPGPFLFLFPSFPASLRPRFLSSSHPPISCFFFRSTCGPLPSTSLAPLPPFPSSLFNRSAPPRVAMVAVRVRLIRIRCPIRHRQTRRANTLPPPPRRVVTRTSMGAPTQPYATQPRNPPHTTPHHTKPKRRVEATARSAAGQYIGTGSARTWTSQTTHASNEHPKHTHRKGPCGATTTGSILTR